MIINLLYRYILFISFFLDHTTIVPAIKTYYLSALAKSPFQTILGTMAAMERENISYRLQSGKAQYIIMARWKSREKNGIS